MELTKLLQVSMFDFKREDASIQVVGSNPALCK